MLRSVWPSVLSLFYPAKSASFTEVAEAPEFGSEIIVALRGDEAQDELFKIL